eukprot:8642541-Pyramimonas_sp.AAC.1
MPAQPLSDSIGDYVVSFGEKDAGHGFHDHNRQDSYLLTVTAPTTSTRSRTEKRASIASQYPGPIWT